MKFPWFYPIYLITMVRFSSLQRGREILIKLRNSLKEALPAPAWSEGWRLTALLACAASLTVLVLNISLLIWYSTAAPVHDGIKVLFSGSCKMASSIDTWLHFLINILSTFLLAGSNFCQRVPSLTRNPSCTRQ